MSDKAFIRNKFLDRKRVNPVNNNAKRRYAQPVCPE
ncbi:MAG: hypothetical protein JWP78_2863 [Mucilaginibacter sp.]|nr:hypothetical protein [Mucilaginibacter sp.]